MTEKIFRELTDEEKAYWRKESIERKERDDLSRLAESRREGEREARRDIACNMKAKGATVKDIAEITGLTEEEVKAL